MRNLTIKRAKRFVASLYKMKVYIEDPVASDLVISGVACRKLGELKNGEEKTFQIDEQARKVYVIADKLSKNYCNEYYQLPAGQEDVFLSGKNCLNPANGNAFQFDNNENEEAVKNRRQGTKKGLLILILAVIIGAAAGFFITRSIISNRAPAEKTFTSHGMSITLTDEFKEEQIEGFTASYDSKNKAVFVTKEPFTLLDGFENYTLSQYIDLVIEMNGISTVKENRDADPPCFEYEYVDPASGVTYRYVSYVYKTGDSFWLVQFSAEKQDAEKLADTFAAWAKTVTFAD